MGGGVNEEGVKEEEIDGEVRRPKPRFGLTCVYAVQK